MGYVSHLACTVCGADVSGHAGDEPVPARWPAAPGGHGSGPAQGRSMGMTAGGTPSAQTSGGSAGFLPLDINDAADRPHIVTLGEGGTPCLPYSHPLADRLGCRLEVKDEGKHYPGFGANPTLSFKDRGMAMTVSMARSLGLTRLAVPTQGNAGDSLAEYAVAAGIEAVIVMSPDTDLPVLGKVAAYARLYPDNVKLDIVAGTIIDCGKRVREHYVPQGYFNVATFQEPGWRTEGKKTLGLEMAEPAGERLADRRWQLPDVIVYPTGGGTGRGRHGQGVRRARGTRPGRARAAPDGLRPEHGQHADRARVRIAGAATSNPSPPAAPSPRG